MGENFIGIVTNSLWDVETSGIATSYGGMGLTTFQMQQAVYFQVNNWGGTVWTIDEGNDYPHLAWENAGGEFIVDTDPEVTLSGYGTAEEPWVIESLDDLNLICTGSFFWDKHYILNSDIDLTGATYRWGLIGYDNGNPFTGSFNGKDHVISNLTINGKQFLGLFGYIGPGGFVSNLGLEDVNITSNYYSSNSGGLAGGNAGSVVNCYATGEVSGTSIIGGLLGGNESNMVNCHATVVVTGHVDSKGVGGLVGVSIGNVTNCYASGTVEGVDYVGGLVGYNNYRSNVTNCYATGAVIGSYYVGGLVGSNDYQGSITNCCSTGPVTGYSQVGGLVGGDYDANGVFVSSYFLDPNDGGGPDNGIGEPLTDIEMKQQASFVDWDFNDIWAIVENTTYPFLMWENEPPIAVPGPNQVTCAGVGGIAEVTLDASASYDPDGDPLDYLWTWTIDDDIYEVNGVSPTIELPVGQHTIELVVSDQYYDSEPNYVTITVIEPLEADIRFTPRVLNLKSHGKFVLCVIRLPEDYSVADIDRDSIRLEDDIQPRRVLISEKSQVALAFFNRADLQAILHPGRVELLLTGRLNDGTCFTGSDTIWTIDPNLWRHRLRHRIR